PLTTQDQTLQVLIFQMLEMDEKRRPPTITAIQQRLKNIKEQPVPVQAAVRQALPATPILPHPSFSGPPGSRAPVLIQEHHYGIVRAVSWSPDSIYVASATDAIIRVWNAQSGRRVSAYRDHPGQIKYMSWSPTGSRIASISEENKVRIWDSQNGQTLSVYPGNPGSGNNFVRVLDWSRDGRLLAVGGRGHISVWDTSRNEVVSRLKHRFHEYSSLSWSPDGTCIAAAYGTKVLIWQPGQGKKVSIYHYKAQVNSVAWSPNGSYLACAGYDQLVHIWNMRNASLQIVYSGHNHPVCCLSWSPDSRRIVSGGFAANLNIWDSMNGATIVSHYAHAGMILAAAWSPDGKSILSGGSDRKVCVWRAP
ncbi:MAG TPA: WD40 repeat domain-containing protein, partial [Ktedonobacteraceae bacterium]|nr:WD40 repeat domain-containing protein [Ktedonobacteraceae bacterium]